MHIFILETIMAQNIETESLVKLSNQNSAPPDSESNSDTVSDHENSTDHEPLFTDPQIPFNERLVPYHNGISAAHDPKLQATVRVRMLNIESMTNSALEKMLQEANIKSIRM